MAQELTGLTGMFKVGSQLFTAEGPAAVHKIASLGAGIFLDLKFHDIPNTVRGAVAAAATLPGVRLMDVHALGGLEMMRAAAQGLTERQSTAGPRPRLLGVTLLTSLDRAAMRLVGISGQPQRRAVLLAQLAQQAGLDGVVASAHETRRLRRACGSSFLVVVAGVRPEGEPGAGGGAPDDQARVATPAVAIRAGADYLVVGRPITAAADPRAAAQAILSEIEAASHREVLPSR